MLFRSHPTYNSWQRSSRSGSGRGESCCFISERQPRVTRWVSEQHGHTKVLGASHRAAGPAWMSSDLVLLSFPSQHSSSRPAAPQAASCASPCYPGCSLLHCAPSCPGCCSSLSPAMALAKLGSAGSLHCCFSLEGRLGCPRWGVPLLPPASSFCPGAAVPLSWAPLPSRHSHTSPELCNVSIL